MSFENVRAFYERLANDEAFRAEIQAVESQEAGQEILRNIECLPNDCSCSSTSQSRRSLWLLRSHVPSRRHFRK